MVRFLLSLLAAAVTGLALFACGGGSGGTPAEVKPLPPGNAADGETVYQGTCIKCHGPDATGIEGSGTNLTTSEYIPSRTDAELVDYIKVGRPMNDPLNMTGVAMPPYGANPMLTDQDLADVVSYLRTINQQP
jgi:mono/diheme cytochrome c family protein